jgi:integrase/recombinase XerD
MRTPNQKAKSEDGLQAVIKATEKLWRRHHLTYDQTRYVSKCARQALQIERPQSRTRIIERLSREEERRLIDTAYRQTGTRGLLIKTLFQTGARVSEFVSIRVEDVYFEEETILIRQGKGGKQRYVPVLPALAQELQTHLHSRTEGYLFETNRHAAFSARRVQQLVKDIANQAGIAKKVSPHVLRHSVATTLLEQGMPLEQIQQFLGHAKIDTTQIYAHTSAAMIKDSYQQALSG